MSVFESPLNNLLNAFINEFIDGFLYEKLGIPNNFKMGDNTNGSMITLLIKNLIIK